MRKLLKIVGFVLLSLILFLGGYMLAAFGLGRMGVEAAQNKKEDLTIYLLTNGVHTDLVLPVKSSLIDWSEHFKYENTKSKQTNFNYLAIGWGDKGFYLDTPTWAELKFSTAFRAATGLSTAAIHATYYRTMTEGEDCIKVGISNDQYQKLINYIQKDLIKKSNGALTLIETDAVYGDSDAFYDATGSYSLFHTCNTWTNNALKAADMKASVWTPFDTGIFHQYKAASIAKGSMYGW